MGMPPKPLLGSRSDDADEGSDAAADGGSDADADGREADPSAASEDGGRSNAPKRAAVGCCSSPPKRSPG